MDCNAEKILKVYLTAFVALMALLVLLAITPRRTPTLVPKQQLLSLVKTTMGGVKWHNTEQLHETQTLR